MKRKQETCEICGEPIKEREPVGDEEIGRLFVEWMFAADVENIEVGNKLAAALEREHRVRKMLEQSLRRIQERVARVKVG
jgi:hypothetical protein